MKTKLNLVAAGLFLAALGTGFGQPVITQQPQSCTNVVGTTATFTVGATGTEPLAYQWQKYASAFTNLVGRTNAALVLTNVQTSHAGDYRVVVTDATGTTNSDVASLTVMVPPGITRITNNNPCVSVGAPVKMQVWVTGTTPSIQWYQNDLALFGRTSLILFLGNVQTTNSGLYTVVVTNYVGSVTSTPVTLQVSASPQFNPTSNPQSKAITVGKPVSFTGTAYGELPLSYQWQLDEADLLGQTNKTLNILAAKPADEGSYTLVVRNNAGVGATVPARLWVVPPSSAFIRRNYTNASGARVPYAYVMPTNANPAQSYPLVCYYIGIPDSYGYEDQVGIYADDLLHCYKVFASYRQQVENPVVLVWLTRRTGQTSWDAAYVAQVQELIDYLIPEFNIDTNRVYAVGGYDAVPVIQDSIRLRPNRFAAVMLCTANRTSTTAATAIKHVPIWSLHSALDETADVSTSRSLVQALRQAGGNPIYTEFASGPHLESIMLEFSMPPAIDWLLKQRLGMVGAEPILTITAPTLEPIRTTGAARLNLGGFAEALGQPVTLAWTNTASQTGGVADGTNPWTAQAIPLLANKTNVVIVTATTTSWAPAYGGTTTFNDTLTVIQSPLQATLSWQGSQALLNWTGGGPPYRVQRATDLAAGDWTDFLNDATPPVPLPLTGHAGFYRILGQ